MKKSVSFLIVFFALHFAIFAQSGSLKGTITDKETGEPLPFAGVTVKLDGTQYGSATCDFDGNYMIKSIPAGKYDVIANFVGYKKSIFSGVVIKENKITFLNMELAPSAVALEEVQIIQYKIPLINKDNTIQGATVTRDDIARMPNRSAHSPTVIVGGVYSKSGEQGNVRGARCEGEVFYVDGTEVDDFNTEEYDYFVENRFVSPFLQPLSTFSIDVDKASYANIRRLINNCDLPQPGAVRIEEMINYIDYDYPLPEAGQPFSINMELGRCPWQDRHQLLMIGIKGEEMKTDEIPPSNLVFLIDVSGSMDSKYKLALLKKAFNILINNLRPDDRVSIIVYAGAAGQVLPPTSGNEKETILAAIKKLQAGGSTAGGAGIKLAYKTARKNFLKNGNNRVILATDGDFNVGVSSNDALVSLIEKNRDDGISLSVLGFGMGNYKDYRMEEISNAGNGNYFYIDNILEAEKVFGKELMGTLYTIAKDVKIQIEFNPQKVKAYRLVGYENRMLEAEDFNDDKIDAGDIGSGYTVTAFYEIIPTGSKEEVASVDTLKYQTLTMNPSDELMTFKLRYKEPNGKKSKLITCSIHEKDLSGSKLDNFRFAACVAEFGLLLRNSEYKGNANFSKVIKRTKKSLDGDSYGYRNEFLQLLRKARLINKNDLAED